MWDVVVIGLGGVGSFALRAASQSAKQLPENLHHVMNLDHPMVIVEYIDMHTLNIRIMYH